MNCHYYSGISHMESQNSIIKIIFYFFCEIAGEILQTYFLKLAKKELAKRNDMMNNICHEIIEFLAVNGMPISEMDSVFEHCLNIDNDHKGIYLKKIVQHRTLKNFHKRCSICGKETDLTIHHIKQKSEYPELRFRTNNMMHVCKDCHKRMHMIDDDYIMGCIGDKNGIE